MRNLITRTFNNSAATCIVYNDGKTYSELVMLPANINDNEIAEKYIRKNKLVSGALVLVEKVEKIGAMYGMEISVFLANATAYIERDKNTRGLVTRYATVKRGELVYYANGKIDRMAVTIPANVTSMDKLLKQLAPANTRGIVIENITETKALYAMTESEFIKLARPMVDNQHFIDET